MSRVIALIAAYNEERFISGCLEHLIRHGVDVYLMDNASTDRTVAIARRYLHRGVLGIEHFPRAGHFALRSQLERKEELAATLEADWFMHADADEIRVPPCSGQTLAEALAEVAGQGYNAVNFFEFTFVPTRESPHHDHPDFQTTMRWYYPFQPFFPHQLKAWRRQPGRVDLASSGGHQVQFPGLRMHPQAFPMRHYLFLSASHALRKYGPGRFSPPEVEAGWHGWRAKLTPDMLRFPSQAELRTYSSDDELDSSHPRTQHYVAEAQPLMEAGA